MWPNRLGLIPRGSNSVGKGKRKTVRQLFLHAGESNKWRRYICKVGALRVCGTPFSIKTSARPYRRRRKVSFLMAGVNAEQIANAQGLKVRAGFGRGILRRNS